MRNAKFLVIWICSMILSHSLNGQYDFTPVFPGDEGDLLKQQLIDEYKPANVLELGEAKDIMYSEIYELNDSVHCVYTGHRLYLDPGSDPSQYLYLGGSPNGINAEHNYPRSKGADSGNAKSDLYNLFPTRTQVNADRANLPFGEIVDAQASGWYYLDDKINQIPGSFIDRYSEISNSLFEPREDHKGNVARSIFYFVTMYHPETMEADPSFFEAMRETLCDWHFQDPVDSLEWIRNQKIANYQSGKQNPFVLDCSLAGRTYCDFIDQGCREVGLDHLVTDPGQPSHILYPNPVSNHLTINVYSKLKLMKICLFDVMGNMILVNYLTDPYETDDRSISLDLSHISGGTYFIEFEYFGSAGVVRDREILIKLPN